MKSGLVRNFGKIAGRITETDEGDFVFSYDHKYLKLINFPISTSLPCTKEPYRSDHLFGFFNGLIPEGWLLSIATHNFRIKARDRMELLLTVCGDCIGSVTVEREGERIEISPKTMDFDTVNTFLSKTKTKKIFAQKKKMESIQFLNRCLVCGKNSENSYHDKCRLGLFGVVNDSIALDISLSDIKLLAEENLNRRLAVTGAQKKLSLSFEMNSGHQRLTLATSDGQFILKPPPKEVPDFAVIEHCSMSVAKAAGIAVAENGIILLQDGGHGYITRRFDRIACKDGSLEKVAMEDFGQIFDRCIDADKYRGTYEQIGAWLQEEANFPGRQANILFDHVFVCYLIGNNDFHLRNIAVMTSDDKIVLTPAFDIVATQLIDPEPDKELTLKLHNRVNNIGRNDWLSFGEKIGIQEKVVIKRMNDIYDRLPKIKMAISDSFLPEDLKVQFYSFIEKKISRSKRMRKII